MNLRALLLATAFVLGSACGSASTPSDAGTAADSGATGGSDAATIPADAGTMADASTQSDAGSGSCSFVGTWKGTYSCAGLSGKEYTWVVRNDGTATGTITGVGTVQQTWSENGTTLTIAEPGTSCPGQGSYTVAYEPSCLKAKLTKISDPCAQRADCVDGLDVTKQ